MIYDIPNMPPKGTKQKDMTPEQLVAFKEYWRRYSRDWARKNYSRRMEKHKKRMETDPEYAARIKSYYEKSAGRDWEARKAAESPEARERRLQRNREHKAKKYREWRLANPIEPKPQKQENPKQKSQPFAKDKKPGRILASLGWR